MKRVAVLIEDMFDEKELIYPYFRLLEAGYQVDLVGTDKDKDYLGKSGYKEKSTKASKDIDPKDYDGVVIPGGFSPDYMRRSKATVDFVRKLNEEGKLVAGICHGPWLMISACNLEGKKLTGFHSIKDDILNAGGEYLDIPVVVDGNLITSRTPKDLPSFMEEIIKFLG